MDFKLLHHSKECPARTGRITLPPLGEGAQKPRVMDTPNFMPVGTQASVKGVTPRALEEAGTRMILCNTYHLMSRPGDRLIRDLGGLHAFMSWPYGIITDSGGFQVYSLAKKCSVDDQGVTFQHHHDGQEIRLEPKTVLQIQKNLGSDIAMVLDECVALPSPRDKVAQAMVRTHEWARISRQIFHEWLDLGPKAGKVPQVFGICQGGSEADLRKESAQVLAELDFPGNALGGFSVGEEPEIRNDLVKQTLKWLPQEKPRYLMGVGTPEDLVLFSEMGVDLYDCVIPTRNARNGQLFTKRGKLIIGHSRFRDDPKPIDSDCTCPTCSHYSRAYLRHLYLAKEMLSSSLNTLHNLHFYQQLMKEIRQAIQEERYGAFRREFFELQNQGEFA